MAYLAGRGTEVAQETGLDVLEFERFAKERVVFEIYHAQGQVERGLEEVIVLRDLFFGQRLALDSGASLSERADALDIGLLSHDERVEMASFSE